MCLSSASLAMDRKPKLLLLPVAMVLFAAVSLRPLAAAERLTSPVSFPIGVVLDFDSLVGKMSRTSISLAIDDFYATHPNYATRLQLHERDSNKDVVDAASEALDLLKNVGVQAIVGPLTSSQAEFVLNLGNKSHVPIVSFSATSPSLSPAHSPYFIRAATNDSSQVGCIAALLDFFGWKQVVPIYEDTAYGTGILPYLVDAFQGISCRIPYRSVIQTSASDDQIRTELYKLKTMSTRVFLVHMSSDLASRFFLRVKDVGMMGEGYVWLITDGLTNLLGSLDPSVLESMQGVLGVRPYVPWSTQLANFTNRWIAKFSQKYPEIRAAHPNLGISLWAYDTIWALALAVERVKNQGTSSQLFQSKNDSTDLGSLLVSKTGPSLLRAIKETRFRGLSGEFLLVDGQLQSSVFQIVNVNEKEGRDVAFWTPSHGITKISPEKHLIGNESQRLKPSDLEPITWPGELEEWKPRAVPKGFVTPTGEKKLKVGVPVNGFDRLVKVQKDPFTNRTLFSGFCIDVFDAVMNKLPFSLPYEYVPFMNKTTGRSAGSYDDLIDYVAAEKLDAVVGATTILSNRSMKVDFTMPFTETGWTMIVRVKAKQVVSAWVFIEPWKPTLWFVSLAFFLFTGFVVWIIEHRVNPDFRGSPVQQFGVIIYFAFSTMVFSHREGVVSNLSRSVMVMWLFVVVILQSSFTANLASHFTVQKMEPNVKDIDQLLRNGCKVGCQDGSFICNHLERYGFQPQNILKFENPEQYEEALSKGTDNGGVSAIFAVMPNIKVFLSKYCDNYTTAGTINKTGGFGFVFPKGSSLVPNISRAILNFTEGEEMKMLEKKWFGEQKSCPTRLDSSFDSPRLSFRSFRGLFFITGGVTMLALLIFLITFFCENHNKVENTSSADANGWKLMGARLVSWAKHFNNIDENFSRRRGILKDEDERWYSFNIYREGAGNASLPNNSAVTSVPHSSVSTPMHPRSGDGGQSTTEERFSQEIDEPQAQNGPSYSAADEETR